MAQPDDALLAALHAAADERMPDAAAADDSAWAALGRELYAVLHPHTATSGAGDALPTLADWLAGRDYTDEQKAGVLELVSTLPQLAALLKLKGVPNPRGWKQKQRWTALQKDARDYLARKRLGAPAPEALTSPSAFRRWLGELSLTDAQQGIVLGLARSVVELAALSESDLNEALPVPRGATSPAAANLRNWGVRAILEKERTGVRSADGVAVNQYDDDVDGRRFSPHAYGSRGHVRAWLSARGFDESHVSMVLSVASDLAALVGLDDVQLAAIGLQVRSSHRPRPFTPLRLDQHPFAHVPPYSQSAHSGGSRARFDR